MNYSTAIIQGLLEHLRQEFPDNTLYARYPYNEDLIGIDVTNSTSKEFRRICMIILRDEGIYIVTKNFLAAHKYEPHIEYADPEMVEKITNKVRNIINDTIYT